LFNFVKLMKIVSSSGFIGLKDTVSFKRLNFKVVSFATFFCSGLLIAFFKK